MKTYHKHIFHLLCIYFILSFAINTSFAQCTAVKIITSSTNLSSGWGTNFNNTTVYIQSDFFIDQPFTFAGCIVKIDPGIRIVVQAGQQLTITNGTSASHFSACTNMWNGITIEGSTLYGDGLLIIDNNTLIEDAENAVLVPNNSSGIFRIQNSTFNKNWIHILIDHIPGNQYFGSSSVVYSNFFCKDLTTNIYATLLSPHLSLRTLHAISYKSAGGTLMPIGSGNTIENAEIGVNNYNSHTDVIDSYIHDCTKGYFGDWDGRMRLYNTIVHDCKIGVESTNAMSYVEIAKNQIYRIANKGIYVHLDQADVIMS